MRKRASGGGEGLPRRRSLGQVIIVMFCAFPWPYAASVGPPGFPRLAMCLAQCHFLYLFRFFCVGCLWFFCVLILSFFRLFFASFVGVCSHRVGWLILLSFRHAAPADESTCSRLLCPLTCSLFALCMRSPRFLLQRLQRV